jgi:ketosteroid isomerase-like protein
VAAFGLAVTALGPPRRRSERHRERDLATNRCTDVVVLAAGDWVVRQHTQHSTTLGGKPYRNVYCFVFRFDAAGRIAYLTEHWNTWLAHKVLFESFEVEPAHPLPDGS